MLYDVRAGVKALEMALSICLEKECIRIKEAFCSDKRTWNWDT